MTDSPRRRSVADRVRLAAEQTGSDVGRLRRSVVFHRVLDRVAGEGLVLKGGFCIEVRLPGQARATRDLDLVGDQALIGGAYGVADAVQDVLDRQHADGFTFEVERVRELRGQGALAAAWRLSVTALLDGQLFERLTIDLVGQVEEVAGGTEPLLIDPPVSIPGHSPVQVEAVDVYQHAAEKFHALGRTYAGDRPSTRVKDLVDLVLLHEAGLITDLGRLWRRVIRVHELRDSGLPPHDLPLPPESWARDYVALIADLRCEARTLDVAYPLIRSLYHDASVGRTPS